MPTLLYIALPAAGCLSRLSKVLVVGRQLSPQIAPHRWGLAKRRELGCCCCCCCCPRRRRRCCSWSRPTSLLRGMCWSEEHPSTYTIDDRTQPVDRRGRTRRVRFLCEHVKGECCASILSRPTAVGVQIENVCLTTHIEESSRIPYLKCQVLLCTAVPENLERRLLSTSVDCYTAVRYSHEHGCYSRTWTFHNSARTTSTGSQPCLQQQHCCSQKAAARSAPNGDGDVGGNYDDRSCATRHGSRSGTTGYLHCCHRALLLLRLCYAVSGTSTEVRGMGSR